MKQKNNFIAEIRAFLEISVSPKVVDKLLKQHSEFISIYNVQVRSAKGDIKSPIATPYLIARKILDDYNGICSIALPIESRRKIYG